MLPEEIDIILSELDLPVEEDGFDYRVEIPAAFYVTVKSEGDLRRLLSREVGEENQIFEDGHKVVYVGWGCEKAGHVDSWRSI